MLTFESAAVATVGSIIEKLTVSIFTSQYAPHCECEVDLGLVTEPSLPKSSAQSRYYRCATIRSTWRHLGNGYRGINGTASNSKYGFTGKAIADNVGYG